MKKSIPIIIAIILTIISLFSCKKDTLVLIPQQDNLTAKGSTTTYNCSTDTTQAAYIQLLNPLTPKSWFNLSFCFTAPVQNIPTPIIYTSADSMPVTLQIFVNQVFTGNGNKFVDEINRCRLLLFASIKIAREWPFRAKLPGSKSMHRRSDDIGSPEVIEYERLQ